MRAPNSYATPMGPDENHQTFHEYREKIFDGGHTCAPAVNPSDSNAFVFDVGRGRDNSRRPKVKLGCESPDTDSSLWFQQSTISAATRTGDETAQASGVCRRDPEVEITSASGVLAARAKHHSRSPLAPDPRYLRIGARNSHQFHVVTPYK